MGILYVVATPIGNLKDISFRALETLKKADFILTEDTQVAKKLLFHYQIQKPLISYHQHSSLKTKEKILNLLKEGKNLALITDAGTPVISDPGADLVSFLYKNLPETKTIAIPGPSALTAALSIAGILANQFTFLGYSPSKKGRQKFFQNLLGLMRPLVFYESPHRLIKTLQALEEIFKPAYPIIIAHELTKIHEEIFRGSLEEAKEYFSSPDKKRGEFVLILP